MVTGLGEAEMFESLLRVDTEQFCRAARAVDLPVGSLNTSLIWAAIASSRRSGRERRTFLLGLRHIFSGEKRIEVWHHS
jgi:hypothetical protein